MRFYWLLILADCHVIVVIHYKSLLAISYYIVMFGISREPDFVIRSHFLL